MPMDTGAIGIRPVTPERPTGRPEGVQRRDDGSSAGTFRPQTNVALKTAVEDLAGTLSKISAQEKFGIAKMPQEVGDIVKNILQQSFSMQETLAQGVGSTIESQRFSVEQLAVFARMLSQIGALADKGFSMQLSDETQAVLSQFKNLLVSIDGGSSLEPVLMSKAAFELIDSKNPEQLPQALYEILSQLAAQTTTTQPQQQPDEGMQFLKQLVQYFMPRPKTTDAPQQQQQAQQQNQQQQPQQNQTPTRRFLSSLFKQYTETSPENFKLPDLKQAQQNQQSQQNRQAQTQSQQNSQTQPQQNSQPQPQQNSQAQPQQNSQTQPQQNSQTQPQQNSQTQPQQNSQTQPQPNSQTQPQPNSQTQSQQNSQTQPQQNSQTQPQPNSQTQPQQNSQTQPQQNSQAQPQQNSQTQSQQNSQTQSQQNSQTQPQQNSQPQQNLQNPKVGEEFLAKQMEMREQMQAAKSTLLKQPLQNDSETMGVMKNLAQLLMRNTETTPRTMLLLQNFVNNSQTMMPETEARHLQNLLRLCQQNVPLTVQQAAVQQNLPDLPRLWAFMQLCEMAGLTSKMNAKAFKRAGKDVAEFANGLRMAMGGENSTVQNQKSFQMMLPLYMGDNETSYPTYLSVYDENEKDKETGEDKKETWVRICILTDNIGAVDLTFRVYEGNQLDMRFYFSQKETAEDFKFYMDDLKTSLNETELNLAEIRIGSVGEKMKVP